MLITTRKNMINSIRLGDEIVAGTNPSSCQRHQRYLSHRPCRGRFGFHTMRQQLTVVGLKRRLSTSTATLPPTWAAAAKFWT